MSYFDYLPYDMFPIIFSYLSQSQLLDILMLDKLIYNQTMKYIKKTFTFEYLTTKILFFYSNSIYRRKIFNGIFIIDFINYSIIHPNILKNDNENLRYAAFQNNCNYIKYLAKTNNIFDKDINTINYCLKCLCLNSNYTCFKLVIDTLHNINFNDKIWKRLLKFACIGGNIDIITHLIELGANDWNGALIGSAINGNIIMLKYFIYRGANDFFHAYDLTKSSSIKDYIRTFYKTKNKLYRLDKIDNIHRNK